MKIGCHNHELHDNIKDKDMHDRILLVRSCVSRGLCSCDPAPNIHVQVSMSKIYEAMWISLNFQVTFGFSSHKDFSI